MIDYKLSEVSKICKKHFINNDGENCVDCPFLLRNFDDCWFNYVNPCDFYMEPLNDYE